MLLCKLWQEGVSVELIPSVKAVSVASELMLKRIVTVFKNSLIKINGKNTEYVLQYINTVIVCVDDRCIKLFRVLLSV